MKLLFFKSLVLIYLVVCPAFAVDLIDIHTPVDHDSYTFEKYPNTNYGDVEDLRFWGGGGGENQEIYIKASNIRSNISSYSPGQILEAKLWIYKKTSDPSIGGWYEVTGIWDEMDITHNTRPSVNSTLFHFSLDQQGWCSLDVTDLIKQWMRQPFANGIRMLGWSINHFGTFTSKETLISDSFSPFGDRGAFFEVTVIEGSSSPHWKIPWFDSSVGNCYPDPNGNVWSVYSIDDKGQLDAHEYFNNYQPMVWDSSNYRWIAENNLGGHPRFEILTDHDDSLILTSNWNSSGHLVGAMTFEPASSGAYSFFGELRAMDWDMYAGQSDTVFTLGKFDNDNKFNIIHSVRLANNIPVQSLEIPEMQNIYIEQGEKLVILVRPTSQNVASVLYFNFNSNNSELTIEKMTPSDCEDVIEYGYGLIGDIDKNCKVDLLDILEMSENWLNCNRPNDLNCNINWY